MSRQADVDDDDDDDDVDVDDGRWAGNVDDGVDDVGRRRRRRWAMTDDDGRRCRR